jgi:hypothetical protein
MFAHQAGEVVAKAELFDKKVGIGSKPFGTRIALILTDYSEKLERILADMEEVVTQVTDLRRQPERQDLAASSSKGVPNLSKLSFPESFSRLPMVEDYTGVDVRVQGCPKTKGRKEGQEPREERPGRDHDFRVQGSRIWIRRGGLFDTGSPPKAWNVGL